MLTISIVKIKNIKNDEEPIVAHMPAWANNPGTFATTTKPDDTHHKSVFELFDKDQSASNKKTPKNTSDKTDGVTFKKTTPF